MSKPLHFSPAHPDAPGTLCILAEVGVNHDGCVEAAVQLVHQAAQAGADAVKFQLFNPEHLLSNAARLASYQHAEICGADNAADLLGALMLSVEQLQSVRQVASEVEVSFVVTPFSLADREAVAALNVDAIKIASPDAVNAPLLKAMGSLNKPLFISTGACELAELDFAADLLKHHQAGGCLMHCVSSYPTPLNAVALGAIRVLADRYALPLGYSDHTTETITGALAVAAGACVLEKHVTHSRQSTGPDHAASLEPNELADYIAQARQAAVCVGELTKRVQDIERDVRRVSRQSVCAVRDLLAGAVLSADDLTVKRPGDGIPAARLHEMVGRRLAKSVAANDLLYETDLTP